MRTVPQDRFSPIPIGLRVNDIGKKKILTVTDLGDP